MPETRRSVLAMLGATLPLLAGCAGPETGSAETATDRDRSGETATGGSAETGPGETGATSTPSAGDDGTGGDETPPGATETPTPDLDLREANVLDVEFEETGDAEYRFDVTLVHDDAGEEAYADWWQVETPDGERLGRRGLLHGHGTEAFTRSENIEVPADVDCVVVRGHDQTHGYGGQAMLVDVATGALTPKRQGSEKESFAGVSCA